MISNPVATTHANVQGHVQSDGAQAPLSDEQRGDLDRDGYLVLPGVIDPGWRAQLAERVDQLAALEGAAAGGEFTRESGTVRLSDLVNKGEVFDGVWTHPQTLAAVAHVLGRPFVLSSLNAREATVGGGHQALHADWGPRASDDEPYQVANALWLLDDLHADNGATRLIPGSHRRVGAPADHYADPAGPQPGEVLLLAPAGTVVVLNAHCWHGGTVNRAGARRRMLHAYYTACGNAQQLDQGEFLRHRTWARLSPTARELLGV
ncbi:MAG: phytanoyl-CoA dioxygenase family protein [Planctomycetes bacterium]|nr:phytanoyl-CoA dioxygenase family protein [Planctomycetota bacterium]